MSASTAACYVCSLIGSLFFASLCVPPYVLLPLAFLVGGNLGMLAHLWGMSHLPETGNGETEEKKVA